MTKAELGEMAINLILTAEMDERSEDGVITVDPDLLFQFLVLRKLAVKKVKKSSQDYLVDVNEGTVEYDAGH